MGGRWATWQNAVNPGFFGHASIRTFLDLARLSGFVASVDVTFPFALYDYELAKAQLVET